jgi:hypothetical protein
MGRIRGRVQGAHRRVIALAGTVAVAAAFAIPMGMHSASAAIVGNPGNVKVTMSADLHTAAADVNNITTVSAVSGTVTAVGVLTFPQANFAFKDVNLTVNVTNPPVGPVAATIGFKAASSFTGTINPTTGAVSLKGSFKVLFSALGVLKDCPIGPVTMTLKTSPGGVKYSHTTGRATLYASGFNVPAIPNGTGGCAGFEASVNDALHLPSTAQTLRVDLQFIPVLHGVTTTPTTQSPASTVDPTTATTGTMGASTSTTAGPTTTVTTAPPTTTTVRVTTTTVKATTTTIAHPSGPTTTTTVRNPGSVTTTTWPQHCTSGDPNRCHDTHHPHVPSH